MCFLRSSAVEVVVVAVVVVVTVVGDVVHAIDVNVFVVASVVIILIVVVVGKENHKEILTCVKLGEKNLKLETYFN
jgi:hypothetical protein